MDFLGSRGTGDKMLDGWYDLVDEATHPTTKQINWDQLEVLQQEYKEKQGKTEDGEWKVDVELEKREGIHDTPIEREYREAEKQADEYWSIPMFRGFTLEESRRAWNIQAIVSDWYRTSTDKDEMERGLISEAPMDQQEALAVLRLNPTRYPPEDVILWQEALVGWPDEGIKPWGYNPARADFRKKKENALLRKYWFHGTEGWDEPGGDASGREE